MFSRRNISWFTPALKRIVRTKQRKFNKYKTNSSNRSFTEYKNFCKFVKSKKTLSIVEQNALSLALIYSITILTQKKQIFSSNSIVHKRNPSAI